MIKLASELIDNYALYQLHKEKSNMSHFRLKGLQPKSIEESGLFYKVPVVPEINFKKSKLLNNYEIGTYSYKSEIQDNGITNSIITGYYRKNFENKDSVNVILVHGWRMDSISRVDNIYQTSFMNLGYNIYHFIMPYHFERNSKDSSYNGELMITADIDRTLLSVQQAVSDLRALIRWLKANTKGKVVLIGVSLGGFLTNLTTTLEDEIDILISVFYANSLAHSVWHTIPGRYIKHDFVSNTFTFEQLQEYWKIITPSIFKPSISLDKILLLSAVYDKYIDFNDSEELWINWDKPKRLVYKCGHAGIVLARNKIAKDSLEFIQSKL